MAPCGSNFKICQYPAVTYAAAEHQGHLFWNTCKRLRLLRKAIHLQVIQISVPSVVRRHQCDIQMKIPYHNLVLVILPLILSIKIFILSFFCIHFSFWTWILRRLASNISNFHNQYYKGSEYRYHTFFFPLFFRDLRHFASTRYPFDVS